MSSFIFYLAGFFVVFPLFGQWTDKGDYKELRVSDTAITQLVVPPNDSLFYVLTKNFQYKKFDYLGNLISEKEVPAKIGSMDFTSINADGRFLFYHDKMFDTETGDTLSGSWISPCQTGHDGYSYTNNLYYDTYSNNLILTFSCVYDMGSGSTGFEDSGRYGAAFFKKSLQDTNIMINYGNPEIVETDIYSKKFLLVGVWSFSYGRPGDRNNPYIDGCSTNVCFYQPAQYALQKSINYSNYWDFEKKNPRYRVKNTDYGFIELNQKKITVTDIFNGKMVDVENFDFDFNPLFIIFSANDRFLIAVDSYYEISIIDIKSKTVVRKYPAVSSFPITDLKLTLQGKGFFVVTKDGSLRLYSLPYLTAIEESSGTQEFSLYPNPATDFIEISYPGFDRMVNHTVDDVNHTLKGVVDLDVAIFNVFGEKVINLTPTLSILGEGGSTSYPVNLTRSPSPKERGVRIDVSSLPPGLYFVKKENKVCNFIKGGFYKLIQ